MTVKEILTKHGSPEAEKKEEILLSYMEHILAANENINLTAITEREEFIAKHIIDSLSCMALPQYEEAETVIDVGTGGGFPGVPLAVASPEKRFLLLDSLNKRLKVVSEICEELGIENVETIHGRAEELASAGSRPSKNGGNSDLRESFDLCLSRAVADLKVLCELCLPFVKVGGCFIAYKGADCEKEVDSASKAIEILGGRLLDVVPQPAVAGMDEHNLVIIKKEAPTDPRYPRRAGKPERSPLA